MPPTIFYIIKNISVAWLVISFGLPTTWINVYYLYPDELAIFQLQSFSYEFSRCTKFKSELNLPRLVVECCLLGPCNINIEKKAKCRRENREVCVSVCVCVPLLVYKSLVLFCCVTCSCSCILVGLWRISAAKKNYLYLCTGRGPLTTAHIHTAHTQSYFCRYIDRGTHTQPHKYNCWNSQRTIRWNGSTATTTIATIIT